MPSLRRRTSAIDAETVKDAPKQADDTAEATKAFALAEEAEAEAEEAEAIAAAARARARAIRLRRQAEDAASGTPTEAGPDGGDEAADLEAPTDEDSTGHERADTKAAREADDSTDSTPGDETPATSSRARWRRLARPNWKRLAVAVAVLCTVAAITAIGYLVWQHRDAVQREQQSAEYVAAGRQGVVNLMSLNFTKAQEDVERIIDNATGQFKEDFEAQADDFVRIAQSATVVTEATINAAAVESMTDDSAVVLIAVTSRVSNSTGAEEEARSFRLSVTVQREGDQIKMSRVEFVP